MLGGVMPMSFHPTTTKGKVGHNKTDTHTTEKQKNVGNNFTTCLTCCTVQPTPFSSSSSSSYPLGEYIIQRSKSCDRNSPPLVYSIRCFYSRCKCLSYRRSERGRVFFYLSLSLFFSTTSTLVPFPSGKY